MNLIYLMISLPLLNTCEHIQVESALHTGKWICTSSQRLTKYDCDHNFPPVLELNKIQFHFEP